MSMFVKKKQILAATLVIALAAAVTVNWYYSKPKTESAKGTTVAEEETKKQNLGDSLLVGASNVSQNAEEAASNAEYFASARLEQKNIKEEIEEEIEKVLKSENLKDDEKTKINSLLEEYKKTLKAQSDCEELIKAKLSGDCVVILNKEKAQVIIENGKSNEKTILQITEIIENNTDVSAENLTIIEAK
ncbi:MAG: SpoIIIAH-like family protein [Clostridia bacterium]|nr:SpoIIIAH-like family protein [Clostridia bacterium]